MARDYAEPWNLYEGYAGDREWLFLQGSDAQGEFDRIIASEDDRSDHRLDRAELIARMKRVRDCVNACAGIDDPAAEIRSMRDRITQLESDFNNSVENWNSCIDELLNERKLAEERLMKVARLQARQAALMAGISAKSRELNDYEWAAKLIFKADEESMRVRREDLNVPHLNNNPEETR